MQRARGSEGGNVLEDSKRRTARGPIEISIFIRNAEKPLRNNCNDGVAGSGRLR